MKAVEVVSSDAELVRLRARPNFRSLGKRYGKRTPAIAAAAAAASTPTQLRGLEQGSPATLEVDGEPATLSARRTSWSSARWRATGWCASDGPFVVALDPAADRRAPRARAPRARS